MPADDLDNGLPERLSGAVYGIACGVLFGFPLGWFLQLRGIWLLMFIAGAGWVMGTTIKQMTGAIVNGTANAFLRLVWPSGNSTPYAKTYSAEQAMAVRGDFEGAMTAYGMAMRLNPDDPEPRFQAAEMLFRSPTPRQAVALFSEGRRLAGENRARELYATQRLIDLYLGPLENPIGALVEVRRLIERFPGTKEAESARTLLDDLKSGAYASSKASLTAREKH